MIVIMRLCYSSSRAAAGLSTATSFSQVKSFQTTSNIFFKIATTRSVINLLNDPALQLPPPSPSILPCNSSKTSNRSLSSSSSSQHAQFTRRKIHQKKNKALNSVKEAGLPILESITRDVLSKTKKTLFPSASELAPSVSQIKVANRMYHILNEELENYCNRTSDDNNIFTVGGEPIVIMDVEVSPDLRHARVFWALPIDLLLDLPNEKFRTKLTNNIQRLLEANGGVLQGLVHGKLRRFHPPRLRWVPASNELIREALIDLESLD